MAEGHRRRYRDRFENESIDMMPEYAVLEKILHGVIVRQDTSDLARRLISQFGSLAGVIDAPAEELLKVKGAGPAAVKFLKSFPAIYERYCKSYAEDGIYLVSDENVREYICKCCRETDSEEILFLCLDGARKFISFKEIRIKIEDVSDADAKMMLDYAVASKATEVFLAQKCVGKELRITGKEKRNVKVIYNALDFFRIHLYDHFAVNETDSLSMLESNMIPRIPDGNAERL